MCKEKQIVPALRFPEFEKDAEWKEKTINALVKKNILFPQKDGNHGNIHPKSSDFVNKGIPFVMASDIRNGKIDYSKCKHISKKQADNLQKGFAKEEDVLLTHKGTVGEVAMIRKNDYPYLMLTPQVTYYRVKNKNELSNEFLRSFFLSNDFQKKLLDTSGGGTRAYVGITAQGKLSITLPPSLSEQQKIANCLTTLNNLITAETEKLDLLKDHKKGLLQQLFPANGETKPQFRFPEFENKKGWNDVKLINVTDKSKKWSFTGGPFGSNLKSSDYVEENEGIRIIQLQNIGDGEFKNDYKIYTSKEKADELLSCNIYPGDIIMSKMGDPVGRACLIPGYHNRYVMSSDGIRIAVDEDQYDKYFIYLVINSKIFRSKVENSSTGSTRKRIGLVDLKKLTLTVPKDKDEQEKIANCFSSADDLIEEQTSKIVALKDHKKGLMQQLFPNINDII